MPLQLLSLQLPTVRYEVNELRERLSSYAPDSVASVKVHLRGQIPQGLDFSTGPQAAFGDVGPRPRFTPYHVSALTPFIPYRAESQSPERSA